MFGRIFCVNVNYHYFYNPDINHSENFKKITKIPTLILVIEET